MEVKRNFGDNIAQLLFPVLLTISFLHCKNIKVRDIVPPEKLSRKHHKKHGYELVRYHILDIEPLRRIFERHHTGSRDDLRRALHICRGHFKTFTHDAPLWGRHTGTYWWASQVRGTESAGIVVKDYRVNAPSAIGTAYREADDTPPSLQEGSTSTNDPDCIGLGLVAHNRTQNKIAEVVRTLGWNPRSPSANDPEFDLAWKTAKTLFVCEVKSLTQSNEERQLRTALGQVMRYKQKLTASGYEPVTAVIAAEQAPVDRSWESLFVAENIIFVWPEVARDRFLAALEAISQ